MCDWLLTSYLVYDTTACCTFGVGWMNRIDSCSPVKFFFFYAFCGLDVLAKGIAWLAEERLNIAL